MRCFSVYALQIKKLKKMRTHNLKNFSVRIALLIASIFLVFSLGSFFPNQFTKYRIQSQIENERIELAKKVNLFEPEFEYHSELQFITAVENCINHLNFLIPRDKRVPTEIIVAQAVLESHWGQSRFALEGNNILGIHTWNFNEPHLKPLNIDNPTYALKKYETKCLCVKDYLKHINNHPAYQKFRELRKTMIKNNDMNVMLLAKHLNKYASDTLYVQKVIETIKKVRNIKKQLTP